MRMPLIASDWVRIVEYPENHLNDFCLFRGLNGTWHAIGIMGTGTWSSEQSLFHCSCDVLLGNYTRHPAILTDTPVPGDTPFGNVAPQKHAPFVMVRERTYHLFYRRPTGTIMCVRTTDPFAWKGLGDFVFERNDARDICILELDGAYLMYYCQWATIDGVDRSCIMLRRSRDLFEWGDAEPVFVDTTEPRRHSYLESPFVVRGADGFYLFIRHRLMKEKRTTVVLFSERPDRFPSGARTWFCELNDIHAPEIVYCGGAYYIARVSGASHGGGERLGPAAGCLEVARLAFE